MSNLTFAIIGAGAVGSYYGAKLAKAGFSVHFYSRQAKALGIKKIQVKSIAGDFQIKANFYDSTQLMPQSDIVVISLKALPEIDYVSLLRPLLKKDTDIVLLQNGIGGEEKLKELFPSYPIHGALAFTCIERKKPGYVEHTDYGLIKMAPLEVKNLNRTKKIAQYFLQAGIETKVEKNLRQIRWEKLLWNIPFNCLSVILKSDTKKIMENPHSAKLAEEIMEEVRLVANKDNCRLKEKHIKEMLKKTQKMQPYHTSMLLDYLAKRPMEIHAILEEPLKIAKKLKVDLPKLEVILRILHFLDGENKNKGI